MLHVFVPFDWYSVFADVLMVQLVVDEDVTALSYITVFSEHTRDLIDVQHSHEFFRVFNEQLGYFFQKSFTRTLTHLRLIYILNFTMELFG